MVRTTRGPVAAWLIAATVAVLVVMILRESFLGMLFQWRSSSTFSYGFLILPISLFLLWRERHRLANVPIRPAWGPLLCMVPVGLLWVLGVVLEVNLVHHAMAVLMLVLAVWTVVGTPVARVIWFPLAYLFLMVPFGEFLVPTLMRWTADFAVVAVSMTGVPVYQDGFIFSLPSGDFEVIKACSGIRFLMATVVAGVVFAWVAYDSWRKRLLFLLACLAVPVLANLLRAYLVVMMVHLSEGRLAGEHVLYGTLFYVAILLSLFLVAARYADSGAGVPSTQVQSDVCVDKYPSFLLAAVAPILLAGLAATELWILRRHAVEELASRILRLPMGLSGYVGTAAGVPDWGPEFSGASSVLYTRYVSTDTGSVVDVLVADYSQSRGAGDVTQYRLQAFDARGWWPIGSSLIGDYAEVTLQSIPDATRPSVDTRVIWSWYVVGNRATNTGLGAKAHLFGALLEGGLYQQGVVAISSEGPGGKSGVVLELRRFTAAFCAEGKFICPRDFRASHETSGI